MDLHIQKVYRHTVWCLDNCTTIVQNAYQCGAILSVQKIPSKLGQTLEQKICYQGKIQCE